MHLPLSQYRHLLSVILALACLLSPLLRAAPSPGGFIELNTTAPSRPLLTRSEILDLLPERGTFTFPAPYNTEAIRLTNEDDCGGRDCVNYIGYSYWNNINNHVGQDSMLIFLGLDRSRGGVGPSLLKYNKLTDAVENLGPLFPDWSPLSWATGEGWYFSATMPTVLYIPNRASLQRFDVITGAFTTVFDVTASFGSGYYLGQAHSSADDRVHSATLSHQEISGALGCVVYKEDTGQLLIFPPIGDFDECQVDKSGAWLVIKDNVDYKNGEDNRIINLVTGQERLLLDHLGAAGHSDLGYGYQIEADNYAVEANTWEVWDFNAPILKGDLVYSNFDWSVDVPEHVSHSNAVAGPAAAQYACSSSAHRSFSANGNDIFCFRLAGHGTVLVVAPVMTNLDASGGGNEYARAPKGNLDVTGKYFIWSSNMGGSRLDVFLVKVPDHLLGLIFTVAPLIWDEVVNAVANGNTVTKTGGCNGCADAGAVSRYVLGSGDGFLEFTVQGSEKQHYVGVSVALAGTNCAQIDYALSLQGNSAEVRENGAYRAETALVSGDVLRITVQNGEVTYARNGVVFYTSTVAPVYPLRVYSILLEANSSISSAVAGVVLPVAPSLPPAPIVSESLVWESLVNASAVGGTLTKVGGCNGCADAGAVSKQALGSGYGFLEFTVQGSQKQHYAGVSVAQAGTNYTQIDYALSLQGNSAEVRENGAYRADTALVSGDVLRIAVENGQVTYARNGSVFYTSTVAPVYPLRVYSILLEANSSISSAVVGAVLPIAPILPPALQLP
jgi:hypothetical protein